MTAPEDADRPMASRWLSRTPPSPHTLKYLVGPVIVLIIMSNVANALFADLQDRNPLLLIALSSINRHLVAVTNKLDPISYYTVGTLRLLVSDPLFFLIGYWYGDQALDWMDRRSPTYGPMIRNAQKFFGKAAWALVLIMPNNWVCLLAGVSGMRIGSFFFFNLVGTVGRLYLIRVLGATFEAPISNVTDFLGEYRWWILAITIPLSAFSLIREFRGGEIESLSHLDEEIHEAAAEAEKAELEAAAMAAEAAERPAWQTVTLSTDQPDVTRRDSAHPPLGSRIEFDNNDFFDQAQLEDLRAYARPVKKVRTFVRLFTYLIDAVVIFVLDIGPAVVDQIPDAPWPVQLLAVMAVVTLISEALTTPFDYWATMVHDKRHGMSNQTVSTFVGDWFKSLGLNMVVVAMLLIPVFAAIHHFETWWLIGAVIFFVFQLFFVFAAPVVLMPRFNKFTPMPDGPVRARIQEIADKAGVAIEGVYTMDGSKRSRRGNAYVAGFGPTKRVVVFDTVMDMPLDQLSQIIAHEIGHYRLNHIVKTFPFSALPTVFTLWFVQVVAGSETVLGWAGVDSGDLGDPAAGPLFLAAFSVPMTVFQITSAWLSRRNEREADLEALELLGNPTAFVHMWPSLVALNKADLEPGFWDRLTASHPQIGERMQFGLDWASMNDVPVTAPDVSAVPAEAREAAAQSDRPDVNRALEEID